MPITCVTRLVEPILASLQPLLRLLLDLVDARNRDGGHRIFDQDVSRERTNRDRIRQYATACCARERAYAPQVCPICVILTQSSECSSTR